MYKDTIFLPKTNFPMKAGLPDKEPKILERWRAMNLYALQRKKFKGRSMHNSMIANGNIIMIGLRDYEAPNYKTCDLLEVYDANDVRILANMPSINIQPLIAIQNAGYASSSGKSTEFNVQFSNDAEMPESITRTTAAAIAVSSSIIEDDSADDEDINPDDI